MLKHKVYFCMWPNTCWFIKSLNKIMFKIQDISGRIKKRQTYFFKYNLLLNVWYIIHLTLYVREIILRNKTLVVLKGYEITYYVQEGSQYFPNLHEDCHIKLTTTYLINFIIWKLYNIWHAIIWQLWNSSIPLN